MLLLIDKQITVKSCVMATKIGLSLIISEQKGVNGKWAR